MKKWLLGCVGLMGIGLAGCGSGSGSVGSGITGGTRSVGVYVTDDIRTGYDKVWAEVHKIEMTSSTGASTVLFNDPKGKIVDLRSLHDAQGSRFLFLSNQSVPAGTYTSMKVTVGNKMTLFTTGATVGKSVTMNPALPVDGQGNTQISVNLPTPVVVDSSSAKVVVDFDLSKFDISGGQVTPVVKKGDTSTIDNPARHENEDIRGVVSALSGTAPALQFTLSPSSGNPLTVTLDSATTLFFQSGATNPLLANGQKVEVRGIVDPTTNTLKATEVKIEDASQSAESHSEVKGLSGDANSTTGTFTITVGEAEDFLPATSKVTVLTNAATVFRADSGVKLSATDFFSRLSTPAVVKAEGTYDAASNTLTATVVKIRKSGNNSSEDGGSGSNGGNGGNGGNGNGGGSNDGGSGHQGREAEVAGTISNSSVASSNLQLNPVTKFEGFSFAGGTLNVVTTDTTEFRGAQGKVSATDFYASLSSSTKVEIKGSYKDGTLTAVRIQVDN